MVNEALNPPEGTKKKKRTENFQKITKTEYIF